MIGEGGSRKRGAVLHPLPLSIPVEVSPKETVVRIGQPQYVFKRAPVPHRFIVSSFELVVSLPDLFGDTEGPR